MENLPGTPLCRKSLHLTRKACQGKQHPSLFVNYKDIKSFLNKANDSHILFLMCNQLELVFSTHLCLQEVSIVNIVRNTFLLQTLIDFSNRIHNTSVPKTAESLFSFSFSFEN